MHEVMETGTLFHSAAYVPQDVICELAPLLQLLELCRSPH
jgi:hypothetical protein